MKKKNNIKWVATVLAACAISICILSIMAPSAQVIKRSVTIHAPANKVYDYLASVNNFHKWSVWSASDPSIQYTTPAQDAIPGARGSWTGNPELAGSGSISITGLESGKAVHQHIELTAPQAFTANSDFAITTEGPDNCTVNWTFSIPAKKPWNVINLFSNVEKQMGPDFEKGLAQLKKQLEATK